MRKLLPIFLLLLIVSSGLAQNNSSSNSFDKWLGFVEVESAGPVTNQSTQRLVYNGQLTLPTGIIALSLITLAVMIYSFEIDPIYIVLSIATGGIALGLYIFNLPPYGSLLAPVLFVVYKGVRKKWM